MGAGIFDSFSTQQRPIVLIVDDEPVNLLVLEHTLQSRCHVLTAKSGEQALQLAGRQPQPDLILLDVMMPGMDGYEVLRRLRSDDTTGQIPVIFITALSNLEDELRGLEVGAVDYITKPIHPALVWVRVRTQLELKRARDSLSVRNAWLDAEVRQRMREIRLIQDLNVRALACIAEARDSETGNHVVRTQYYVRVLATHLRENPRFKADLSEDRLHIIVNAAALHDIGKVGIPDAILLKPGRLTRQEREIMKTHTVIGANAINRAIAQSLAAVGDDAADLTAGVMDFLRVAQEIALNHHEEWDGSGYPAGLAGDAIPASARLMALADVFDALTCRRVYKLSMSIEEATRRILDGKGSHFDPDVVDAYISCYDQFIAIFSLYADSTGSQEPLQTHPALY